VDLDSIDIREKHSIPVVVGTDVDVPYLLVDLKSVSLIGDRRGSFTIRTYEIVVQRCPHGVSCSTCSNPHSPQAVTGDHVPSTKWGSKQTIPGVQDIYTISRVGNCYLSFVIRPNEVFEEVIS